MNAFSIMQKPPSGASSHLPGTSRRRQRSVGSFTRSRLASRRPSGWDSFTKHWAMKHFPDQTRWVVHFSSSCSPASLSLLLALESSTQSERLPCSQHGGADAGWKGFRFLFSSSSLWENEPVSGISGYMSFTDSLCWNQVQYVSASPQQFHLARHKNALQSTVSFGTTITAAFPTWRLPPKEKSVDGVKPEKQQNISYFAQTVPWKSHFVTYQPQTSTCFIWTWWERPTQCLWNHILL